MIMQIIYHIDSENNIYQINQAWDEFAMSNDAAYLIRDKIVGNNIFSFISSEAMREIWSHIFKRCRRGADLIFDYRCDSPDVKRFMKMELKSLPDNHIKFISTIINEEKIDLKVIDTSLKRNENKISMCSWCKKIRLSEHTWLEIDKAIDHLNLFFVDNMPQITHGICKTCKKELMANSYKSAIN
jgi:hypothetical protein